MSLEYLEGYSNQGGSADVWILRDESGKNYCFHDADFHKLFIVCQHISAADVVQYNQKTKPVFNTTDRKEKML